MLKARVSSAHYDEANAVWRVRTADGQTYEATWLIMATGCLSIPQ